MICESLLWVSVAEHSPTAPSPTGLQVENGFAEIAFVRDGVPINDILTYPTGMHLSRVTAIQ